MLGRMPSAVGYQPTLATEMGLMQERITSTKNGSITSVQAVYVPADDLTDPAPATTFAHLDSTIVLSRALTELGLYPAVDPLASFSRIEEKVNQQEARAAALGELDADTTEHRFQLMQQESEVDQQLAALKEKKGLAAPAADPAPAAVAVPARQPNELQWGWRLESESVAASAEP